jgi:hypothetical protein
MLNIRRQVFRLADIPAFLELRKIGHAGTDCRKEPDDRGGIHGRRTVLVLLRFRSRLRSVTSRFFAPIKKMPSPSGELTSR